MTSQLPYFWCLSQLPAAKKHTKNWAAVTSLKFESSAFAFVCFEISTLLKLEISTLLKLEISSFRRVENFKLQKG